MDPTTCYREMREAFSEGDYDRAAELAEALTDWLRGGGFPPEGKTNTEARDDARTIHIISLEQLAREGNPYE